MAYSPELGSELQKARTENQSRLTAIAMTLLIHLLVFGLLAWIVLVPFSPEPPTIEFIAPASSSEKPKLTPRDFTDRITREKPSRPSSAAPIVITAPVPSDVSLISVEVDVDTFGIGLGHDFSGGGFEGTGPGGGPPGVPETLKGRCNQTDRIKRLRENGGSRDLDRKVIRALDWLQQQQNADGSWGQTYPVAMTGFAVLAFSGHCETVDSPEYGETLIKAIAYLVDKSGTNNGMLSSVPGNHAPYEHGIATYALAEAYSLNKNALAKHPRISPALRNAVPIIIEGQTKGGGWLYAYRQNGTGDLSISGWNIQALKAAELTGLKFSGLSKAKKQALAYLKVAVAPNGLYRYRITDRHPGRLSLTGVGVLCGRMLGQPMPNEDKSFSAILAAVPQAYRSADLYALYYNSQACFQKGGATWKKYNSTQQKLIIDSQEKDGSWPVAAGHIGGAQADAKIYHTCLCTLMLEVYYRYLPATAS
ncbi:MAG: hypothetical protein ACI8XO_003149 [Verrucomicrobiales bacterium]